MILIMLGAPGTGKGTISNILQKELNIPQISTGDIFRQNIADKTELGKKVEEYTSKGELVPDEITVQLVEDRLNQDDATNGAILDGFPRTVSQAEALDVLLSNTGKKVDMVVNLTSPKEEIMERIVNRRICSKCKASYNVVLNPPKQEGICDKCGGELITREDDNVETVEKRLQTYLSQTKPLVDYYEAKKVLYQAEVSRAINKMGKEVAQDLIEYIEGENV